MAPTRSLLLSGVALTLIMGSASIPTYGANGTRHLPIVLAAAIEKLGLVICVATNWQVAALQGLHVAAVFDGICVMLYATLLLRRSAPPASVSRKIES